MRHRQDAKFDLHRRPRRTSDGRALTSYLYDK